MYFSITDLKYAVGRINTRFWLLHPEFEQFHWFHGQGNYMGFPSGHMAVFTALIIALRLHYPRYRPVYLGFSATLAMALILTDYHFLSDVIAAHIFGFDDSCGSVARLSLLNDPQRWNNIIE